MIIDYHSNKSIIGIYNIIDYDNRLVSSTTPWRWVKPITYANPIPTPATSTQPDAPVTVPAKAARPIDNPVTPRLRVNRLIVPALELYNFI